MTKNIKVYKRIIDGYTLQGMFDTIDVEQSVGIDENILSKNLNLIFLDIPAPKLYLLSSYCNEQERHTIVKGIEWFLTYKLFIINSIIIDGKEYTKLDSKDKRFLQEIKIDIVEIKANSNELEEIKELFTIK